MQAAKWPDKADPTGKHSLFSGFLSSLMLPVGWFLSEKIDGVRGYWNGFRMISKTGSEIWLPDGFKALLPTDLELDGEFSYCFPLRTFLCLRSYLLFPVLGAASSERRLMPSFSPRRSGQRG